MPVANIPVPADGKSITPDDVRPMLEQMVKEAVSHIPAPRDGRDYDPEVLKQAVLEAVNALPAPQDGRDATALEVLPAIDDQKSFPRGTYATHLGGLWRAYEKTHGMRGWECLVDGVADIDVSMTDERFVLCGDPAEQWPVYGKNIFPAGDALPRCVQSR